MSQGILMDIEQLVKKMKSINDEKVKILIQFLAGFNRNEYIYPGALISKLDITSEVAYKILRELETNNYVSKSYEVYCKECSIFKGTIYDFFADIPDEIYCPQCLKRLDPINDTIVIYRIVTDLN